MERERIIRLLEIGAIPVAGSDVTRNYSGVELTAWLQGVTDTLEVIKRALAAPPSTSTPSS